MTALYRTAYDLARERRRAQNRRVVLPRPRPVRAAVALRPAAEVPFTPPAVSILAPVPETDATLHQFVLEQFREAARKRDQTR